MANSYNKKSSESSSQLVDKKYADSQNTKKINDLKNYDAQRNKSNKKDCRVRNHYYSFTNPSQHLFCFS